MTRRDFNTPSGLQDGCYLVIRLRLYSDNENKTLQIKISF